MSTLLQIKTSIFADSGVSSALSDRFVERWGEANPEAAVIVRDLGREPVPHLDADNFRAFSMKPEQRNAAQQAAVAFSDKLINELRRADVIVLGLPMYNFGVPSSLKAYFDHIARAGVTFRYTDKGPVGLLTGKTVYVTAARGGKYAGTPNDTQTTYVKNFLGFLGLDEVHFVYAEGLAMGEEAKVIELTKAMAAVDRLAAGRRAPAQPADALAA